MGEIQGELMLKKLLALFLVVGLFAMGSVSLADEGQSDTFDITISLFDETGA